MSDNKKYYYLKLKENFFDREEIKVIKGMDKGDTYVCIMLELYLRSLKRDGLLMMTDRIPYNLKTLSSVLGRPQDEIKFAIDLFNEFKLVDTLNTGEMYMSDIQNFIGQSSSEGDRKREYRKSIEQKRLGHLSDNRPPELELEPELKLEPELDTDTEKPLSTPIPKKVDVDKTVTIESKKTDTPIDEKKLLEDNINKIYKAYPKKTAKQKALASIKKALKKISFDKLLPIVVLYAKYRKNEDPQYTPYPATWFNNDMWNDIEDFKPSNNFKQNGQTPKPNSLSDPSLEVNQGREYKF
jgi:predicted phage replisome organizer|tara:strand:- start:16511 stop:17401 length:891 start_codon:yes stop_codon:yes gene_type:complete